MAQQNNPNNPNQQPMFPNQPGSRDPRMVAQTVGNYCRAAISIACWLVLAALTIALVWLALRGIWWGLQLATEALGLGS